MNFRGKPNAACWKRLTTGSSELGGKLIYGIIAESAEAQSQSASVLSI